MSNAKNTLLLDQTQWDLVLDANGNIAMASPPYALAQDVASAIKTFAGEVWYDATIGLPYSRVLGQPLSIPTFQQLMVQQALTVPGVVSAQCNLESFQGRSVVGTVTFTDDTGNTGSVTI